MAENFLKLTITSNVNDFHSDRTFPSSTTVGDLKVRKKNPKPALNFLFSVKLFSSSVN